MRVKRKFVILGLLMTIILLIVVLLTTRTIVFYQVKSSHDDSIERASEIALSQSPIETIEDSFYFTGETAYYVFLGENNDEKAYYVFVSTTLEDEDLDVVEADDWISREALLENWRSECADCQLVNLAPGIQNDQYIWELSFKRNDQLVIQTYPHDSEEIYDSISFNKPS